MPTYVYRIVSKDPKTPERTFEIRQSMKDAPLTAHPETGEPVERVICAPQVASP
jgi:predicted nucleic acid-binding Zn ribbon protein